LLVAAAVPAIIGRQGRRETEQCAAYVSACVRRPTLVDGTRTQALASTAEGDRGRAEEAEEEEANNDIASTCASETVALLAFKMIEI
jgi:hypothetical protein